MKKYNFVGPYPEHWLYENRAKKIKKDKDKGYILYICDRIREHMRDMDKKQQGWPFSRRLEYFDWLIQKIQLNDCDEAVKLAIRAKGRFKELRSIRCEAKRSSYKKQIDIFLVAIERLLPRDSLKFLNLYEKPKRDAGFGAKGMYM
jgi:hypothetical protein